MNAPTLSPQPTPVNRRTGLLAVIGPGILVAATGVGAGDLATGAFTGTEVGVAVLWAVLFGALLKFAITEGLARWQLATGNTLLEGAVDRFGLLVALVFLPYLLAWSFFVGAALMSACGATFHAMWPVFEDAVTAKRVFGMAHSAIGLALVLYGGFRLFEKVMSICIGVMFVIVLVTAVLLWPGTAEVMRGLFVPDLSTLHGGNLRWTVALMGGIGGTVTVLCYGYWIRERGRTGQNDLGVCRVDLGIAYTMTALFGIAMVIIGSTVSVEGKGSALLVTLSDRLAGPLGETGRWAFLFGAWAAIFSSLLGVWQAVPYLFADTWRLLQQRFTTAAIDNVVDTTSRPYRAYLCTIATVPAAGLFFSFREIQQLYAIAGAAFIPLLALALLVMNGRADWVGAQFRNRWPGVVVLTTALLFFAWYGWMELSG